MNETKKDIDKLEIKMEEANIGITMVNDCKIRLIFRAKKNADIDYFASRDPVRSEAPYQ